MKTAKELFDLASKQKKNKVSAVLNGAFDHMEKRIEEEALKGSLCYNFCCDKIEKFCRDELLAAAIVLIKPFEDQGMVVTMVDNGNGYWTNLSICISWDETEHETDSYMDHLSDIQYPR